MKSRNIKISKEALKESLKKNLPKSRQGQDRLKEEISHALLQSVRSDAKILLNQEEITTLFIDKPTLSIQIGRCIEGMNLVIPEHYSLAERARLENEYLKFHQHLLKEKLRWISSLQELVPSVFDGKNTFEIQPH